MTNVSAYLHFNGNARDVLQFYAACLGAEPQFVPMPDDPGRLMHGALVRNGQTLLFASDALSVRPVQDGNNFTISVGCESAEEVDRLFNALSPGAKIEVPVGDAQWGGRFGMLTDKFGIGWMFNFMYSA